MTAVLRTSQNRSSVRMLPKQKGAASRRREPKASGDRRAGVGPRAQSKK